jgi:peptidoglycan hydrolase-like protein with peptidoglycan-binding domain
LFFWLELRMRGASPIRNWLVVVVCGLVCLALPAVAATTTPAKKSTTTATTASAKSSTLKGKHSRAKTKARSSKKRGQKAIDAERTQQIQAALNREHYLEGKPSGKWDDATQAALRRYQADQGWQSKTVPDSRALIKLGLGPSHDHLLNPESAMTTAPVAVNRKASKPPAADPSQAPATSTPAESGVPQK